MTPLLQAESGHRPDYPPKTPPPPKRPPSPFPPDPKGIAVRTGARSGGPPA